MPATRLIVVVVTSLIAGAIAHAQERFSFFQASTVDSVERLLTLAELRDDDVVVDLGSGNGLIPLTAARMNPKLRGWGVDINAELVTASNEAARDAGVADRVQFFHRNAFDADLSDATVITMWLFPELMQLLRPIILERARPGTRVLTSTWALGEWKPDAQNDDGQPTVYKWIVPARVGGAWAWRVDASGQRFHYAVVYDQHFQTVEGFARVGGRREILKDVVLTGETFSFGLDITLDGFGLTRHEFLGVVRSQQIEGTVRLTPETGAPVTVPWLARRTARSDYFAPTGLGLFERAAPAGAGRP
jgi:precorrin-6B methylase 2